MGRSHHALPAQAHTRRKALVVRKGGGMTKDNKRQIGQSWTAILRKAGVPDAPGYHETIAKLYPQEKTNDTRSN